MAIECKHGQLARSCEICELEAENVRLRAENERLRAAKSDADSVPFTDMIAKAALDAAGGAE